jgi:AraC-like DNA-binding protein
MQAAGSIAEFVRESIGRWVAGSSYIVWSWSTRLSGAVFWGRPSQADIEQFFYVVDGYQREAAGRDVITDVSRIESVDSSAYMALVEGMRKRLPWYAQRVRRHAMVRADGLLGGLAEGFFPLVGAHHQWRIFCDAERAFRWMEQPDAARAQTEVARISDEARGLDPNLRRVRLFLEAHVVDATLPATASALGVSERTLHRLLRAAGTTFREVLGAVRVDSARRLLVETDLKIEAIALRVGCCSHAHLTSLFRRTTAQTPVDYRTQMRLAHDSKARA